MSKQISSVEWLVNVLNTKYGGNDFIITHASEIEQAKAMHKAEIIEANIAGMEFIPSDPKKYTEDATEYYKDTFA